MTFKVEKMQPINTGRKAHFPFKAMKFKPGTGFVVPADRKDLFTYARVAACLYNKRHGTNIHCNKQVDGSLRVWNERTDVTEDNTLELLEQSVIQVETAKQTNQAPSKEQFVSYLRTLQDGITISIGTEYAHRFAEFEMWIAELDGYDSKVTFNPPELKITKQGEFVK